MDHLFKECHITRKNWELADKHQQLPSSVSRVGY